MTKPAHWLSAVFAGYFGLMLTTYLAREVQGGSVARTVAVLVAAYYSIMTTLYLLRLPTENAPREEPNSDERGTASA
jgi:hypothetical protein